MPTPKGTSTSNKIKPTLEILPDTRFVVFAGDEHEASTTKLTGRVRLNCPEAMSISRPKIRIEGIRKVSWVYLGAITSNVTEDKRVFLNEERPLGSIESTHKVNAGSIEWPFEFELPPSLPESVEGLRNTYIIYHIHATVSRPGWGQKDMTAREHLRLVRTLGPESMETTRSRVNADVWANKLSYSISIPSDAVIFGTSITADVELSPIKKGIRLGRVEMRLIETIVKRIPHGPDVPESRNDRAKQEESEVAKVQMDFPETAKVTYEDETTDNPIMADEMYKFQATLPLPKSLHQCRQDVDSHQINISHRFKLMVNIHNPEGHVSQLVCRLPVKLFISPNLPIDDQNQMVAQQNTQAALDSFSATAVAPPQYGQHQLDQIFSDIDPAGYMSRAGSGANTPAGLLAQSRRGSVDNLQSLNSIAAGDQSALHGSAMPAALHTALTHLRDDNGSSEHTVSRVTNEAPGSASGTPILHTRRSSPDSTQRSLADSRTGSAVAMAASPGGSPEGPRRPSNEDHADSLHFNIDSLSRVPSYNAALRTPIPPTPYCDNPPSYIDATSRPPSPRLQSTSHLLPTASIHPPLPSSTRLPADMPDDESRLRTLRAQT